MLLPTAVPIWRVHGARNFPPRTISSAQRSNHPRFTNPGTVPANREPAAPIQLSHRTTAGIPNSPKVELFHTTAAAVPQHIWQPRYGDTLFFSVVAIAYIPQFPPVPSRTHPALPSPSQRWRQRRLTVETEHARHQRRRLQRETK